MIEPIEILDRLQRIEVALESLVRQRAIKDWYSTQEFAEATGRKEWTIRNACRLGRIAATKKRCGRGPDGEWMISHKELE